MGEGHDAMILTFANPKDENGFGRNAAKTMRKSAWIVAVAGIARKRRQSTPGWLTVLRNRNRVESCSCRRGEGA
jgi:hypothetical protein